MPLIVYTGRLPCHGQDGYQGDDALDVTRTATGFGRQFAPSRELLNEGQRRKRLAGSNAEDRMEAWLWYAPRYIEEMRESFKRRRSAWDALLEQEVLTLCCYCGRGGKECHRRLLAEILVRLGAQYRGER